MSVNSCTAFKWIKASVFIFFSFFELAPASYASNYDTEKLTTDLNTANKKIDHLSEVSISFEIFKIHFY